MKLRNLSLAAIMFSALCLGACTATGSVGANPSPSASVTASPVAGKMTFTANLMGSEEVPAVTTGATGTATLVVTESTKSGVLNMTFQGLSSAQTDAHIHGPANKGANADVMIALPTGQVNNYTVTMTDAQIANLKAGQLYINVHTANNPNGEIRGQLAM